MKRFLIMIAVIVLAAMSVPAYAAQNTVTIVDSASYISSNLEGGYLYFRSGLVCYDISAQVMNDFYYNQNIKYYMFVSNGITIKANKNNFYDFNLKSIKLSVNQDSFGVVYYYTDDSSRAVSEVNIPIEYTLSYPQAGATTAVELNGKLTCVKSNDTGKVIFESRTLGTYKIIDFEFDDVKATDKWYYSFVNASGALGILNGMDGQNFVPLGNVTRAQLAAMIVKATDGVVSYRINESLSFGDVSSSRWYYPYIMKCATMGIVNGVGDGNFNPEANATRQEIATVVARLLKIIGSHSGRPLPVIDSELSGQKLESLYPDSDKIYNFAKDSVVLCNELGIMTGDSEGFRPLSNATRAECAKIFYLINQCDSAYYIVI